MEGGAVKRTVVVMLAALGLIVAVIVGGTISLMIDPTAATKQFVVSMMEFAIMLAGVAAVCGTLMMAAYYLLTSNKGPVSPTPIEAHNI